MRSVEKYPFCTESEKNTQPVARVGKKIPSALRVKTIDRNLSHVARKPVFGFLTVSHTNNCVPHKPGCTATEDGLRLEISVYYLCRENKGTDQLCAFVFAFVFS